ncbi:MAG TPA: thioredoxin-disulfide reductase [Chloroflexi bacterium]|nr:thioredoxin-disulfide reductase [Chloroflexota bacterium]
MEVYDVIIIGSGPAGLAAAIYAARSELKTLLFTGNSLGGQAALTDEIENYPGFPEGIAGAELTKRMQEQARRFGAEIQMDEVTAVNLKEHPFTVTAYGGDYKCKALIIATGVSPRKLDVPGEEKFIGRGVSFCATCDGFFYKDREVAVIGGGDSAVTEAIYLTRFAKKVYLIHRRDRLRAAPVLQTRAKQNERIEFVWNSVVTEVVGKEAVEGLRLKNVRTGEESFLRVDGIFVYIGQVPNTRLFEGQLELDERGYIVTDRAMHTSVPGVFAAGDVQERVLAQVVTAAATGAIAAVEAEKFIAYLEGREYPGKEWPKAPPG